MKTLILMVFASSLFAMEDDKRDHATAGALIGTAGYLGTAWVLPDSQPWQRFLIGSLAATAAGWGKELYDRQGHGTYESRDAWMTALGGAGASGVVFLFDWSF